MSAVLLHQRLITTFGQPATFSKMEMQDSPFLSATFGILYLQKTCRLRSNKRSVAEASANLADANFANSLPP